MKPEISNWVDGGIGNWPNAFIAKTSKIINKLPSRLVNLHCEEDGGLAIGVEDVFIVDFPSLFFSEVERVS